MSKLHEIVSSQRLFFIDALRAFAILMMLQGHFIDALLNPIYRDSSNWIYSAWFYMRGVTAPIFFTITGFVFTFLLLRRPDPIYRHKRIKKGLKRAAQLLFWGYFLRLNFWMLLEGKINASFWLVDVLHIISLSLLIIIAIAYFLKTQKMVFLSWIFGLLALIIFLFEPRYSGVTLPFLPEFLANYFSKAYGSVFTLLPWIGYVLSGGFMAILYLRWQSNRNVAIWSVRLCLFFGCALIFFSSGILLILHAITGWSLLYEVANYNYLFQRLGDVLVLFAFFQWINPYLKNGWFLEIGTKTLSIYIVHFVLLYGSWFGWGFYRYWHHKLNPLITITGATFFVLGVSFIVLIYFRLLEEPLKKFLQKIYLYRRQPS